MGFQAEGLGVAGASEERYEEKELCFYRILCSILISARLREIDDRKTYFECMTRVIMLPALALSQ